MAVILSNILISVYGASIEQSVSVSVSTSSKSINKNNIAIENNASARSLNSGRNFENKVEISAPYAKNVVNNFTSEEKSRSLKEQHESTTKIDDPTTKEKPDSDQEMKFASIQSEVTSENDVKSIALNLNSQIPSETVTEKEKQLTTKIDEISTEAEEITKVTSDNGIVSGSTESIDNVREKELREFSGKEPVVNSPNIPIRGGFHVPETCPEPGQKNIGGTCRIIQ